MLSTADGPLLPNCQQARYPGHMFERSADQVVGSDGPAWLDDEFWAAAMLADVADRVARGWLPEADLSVPDPYADDCTADFSAGLDRAGVDRAGLDRAGLATMLAEPPTGRAARALEECVPILPELGEDLLVDLVAAAQRVSAWAGWVQLKAIAELLRSRCAPSATAAAMPEGPAARSARELSAGLGRRSVIAEVALACGLSEYAVAQRVDAAQALESRLPITGAAMRRGELDWPRVQAIADATFGLTDQVATRVEAAVFGPDTDSEAVPEGADGGPIVAPSLPRLRRALAAAVAALDPDAAAQAERARRQRRVAFSPAPDGMMEIWALVPAGPGRQAELVLRRRARLARTPGDDRTADELRADTLIDLILGHDLPGHTHDHSRPTSRPAEPVQPPVEPMSPRPESAAPHPEPAWSRSEPAQPHCQPAEADPEPAQADPEPAQADPEPAQADPEPAQADPEPAQADPEPASGRSEPTIPHPEPMPTGPARARDRPEQTSDRREAASSSGEHALEDPELMAELVDQLAADLLAEEESGGGTGPVTTHPPEPCPHPPDIVRRLPRQNAGRSTAEAQVIVTVTLETLLGLRSDPGWLQGYGPLPAAMVREVAASGTWRCAVIDDVHGTLLGLGRSTWRPRYRPGQALSRHVGVRDQTCSFPGCSRSSPFCDVDHRTPHPDGPTCECNLGALCGHHHRLKHEARFSVGPCRHPDRPPGTLEWTTPTGRVYHRQPMRLTDPVPGRDAAVQHTISADPGCPTAAPGADDP
jgi:hypothetical protein